MIKCLKTLQKDSHYYLAVSMGADSLAALFFLKQKGFHLTAIHFNHKLRAQNDIMMDKFVELCDEYNIQNKVGIGNNLSSEADCRKARLDFYSEVAAGGTIIIAHHLNDWVENYLLNCFRGHPHHKPFEIETEFENFKIIHPFLLTRKRDFVEYLQRNNWLRFVVEDESNVVVKGSRRNWIRSVIVPEMSKQKLSLEKYAQRKIKSMMEVAIKNI